MKKIYLSTIFIALMFCACGTKREYFEPTNIQSSLSYSSSLPASIVAKSRYGATLQNGQIITSNGLSSVVLPKGFSFLSNFEDKIILSDDSGNLQIFTQDGKKAYERQFNQAIASASLNGSILAVIDSKNTLYLVNMSDDKVYYTSSQDATYALDARISAPFFLNSLVIFPTLDGKLVIVDKKTGNFIRDFVVSSEPFFNNIIALGTIKGRLVAATSKRIVCISPSKKSFFEENLKDVLFFDENIIVLSQDGRVLKLDLDLKLQKEKKFLFALFLGLSHDKNIFVAEKNGYLISLDKDLSSSKIYSLPSKIDDLTFISKDHLFYQNHSISLEDR